MGLMFSVGHPDDVLGEELSDQAIAALQSRFGEEVPLGTPGQDDDLPEELDMEIAWPWWGELQRLAEATLGAGQAPHLTRIDACMGVYLDTRTEPGAVWPGEAESPQEETSDPPSVTEDASPPTTDEEEEIKQAVSGMAQAMFKDLGPRPGEEEALQVADLRALREELRRLAEALGYRADDKAMRALSEKYFIEERFEEDGPVQALAYLWLASSYAIATSAPLWVVK
jgi:hypothetical protein